MKKILSLTLVLVLVLGSFPMAFADNHATFSDVEDEDVMKAVQRLSGFDIVDGYDDGTYKPDEMVTRAEFSKMLVTALGLENAVPANDKSSKFTDVNGNEWYAGYVNVASGQGVVGGYPDGSFKPNAKVTYAEAATMLVRALGYKDEFLSGSWPENYVARAAKLDITDDVQFFATGHADRGSVAVLVNNTLDTNIVERASYGLGLDSEDSWVEAEYETLLSDSLGIDKFESVKLTATPKVESSLDSDQAEFVETDDTTMNGDDEDIYLPNDVDVEDAMMLAALELRLGESLNVYLDGDELVYFETADRAYDVVYGTADVSADDEMNITFVDGDDADYDYEDDEIVGYVDNEEIDDADELDGLFGKFVLADNGDVVFADVHDFDESAAVITEMEDEDFYYADGETTELSFESDDFDDVIVLSSNGDLMSFDDLAEDDVVYVNEAELAESGDEVAYLVVVETEEVEETADSFDINDELYDESEFDTEEEGKRDVADNEGTVSTDKNDSFIYFDDANDELDTMTDENSSVRILFNLTNDIRHIESDIEVVSDSQFGILLGVKEDLYDEGEVTIKLLASDGEEYEYDIVDFDEDAYQGFGFDSNDEEVDLDNAYDSEDFQKGDIIEYTVDDDADIDSLILLNDSGDKTSANTGIEKDDFNITYGTLDQNLEDDSVEFYTITDYNNGNEILDNQNFTVSSNILAFDYSVSDYKDVEAVDYESIIDAGEDKDMLVVSNDKEEVEFLVFFDDLGSDDEYAGYITDTDQRSGDEFVTVLLPDGEEKELEVNDFAQALIDEDVKDVTDDVAEDAIIIYEVNSDDTIDIVGLSYRYADASETFEYEIGQIVKRSGDWIYLDTEASGEDDMNDRIDVRVKIDSDAAIVEDGDYISSSKLDLYDFVLVAQDGTHGRVIKRFDIDYEDYGNTDKFEETLADIEGTNNISDFYFGEGDTPEDSGGDVDEVTYIINDYKVDFNTPRLVLEDIEENVETMDIADFDAWFIGELEVTEDVMNAWLDAQADLTTTYVDVTEDNELVVTVDDAEAEIQSLVDAELAKLADNYDIAAADANGDVDADLEAEVKALVEADVDTDLVSVSVSFDANDDFDVTLTSDADGTIDNTKSVTAVVVPDAVNATESGANSADGTDGTATITVTVADEFGYAIKDLEEADFAIYETGTTTDFVASFDSFTNKNDGTYDIVVSEADGTHNVDVVVDGVEVETNLGVGISGN